MKEGTDKLKKRSYSLVIIGLLILAPTFIISAYWGGMMPADAAVEIRVDVGQWIYGVRTYHPDLVIKKGDVIEHDGTIYTAIRDPLNDLQKDPERIRIGTNPVYAENTKEYRSYHYYFVGDLVQYNGAIYRWHGTSAHLPNSGLHAPGDSRSHWYLFQPEGNKTPWSRYAIYLEGDEVSQGFYNYRSKTQHSGIMPPRTASSNDHWMWIRQN